MAKARKRLTCKHAARAKLDAERCRSMLHAQAFADAPNVTVVEIPINDGWTRDVSGSLPSVSELIPFCVGLCHATMLPRS